MRSSFSCKWALPWIGGLPPSRAILTRGPYAELVHRSKRRPQPEFGKIDAKQRARAMAHERRECVSGLAHRSKRLHETRYADARSPGSISVNRSAGSERLNMAMIRSPSSRSREIA